MNPDRMSTFLAATAIAATALAAAPPHAHADDWPQWRGPHRDGQWRETGIIERFESDTIDLLWSVEIGPGYSGPTVADGRVYVTDRLDEPEEIERVHCFDAATGEPLWSHRYPAPYGGIGYQAGPRASVLVHEGRAYSLGAAGHLHCFDAATGDVLWKRDLADDYRIDMPNWGIAASPLIEGDVLILQIGGENACFVGLDKRTGEHRWATFDDAASYVAPIVVEQAGRRVVVGYSANHVVGLDPATGNIHWTYHIPEDRWPIAIATPVVHGDLLFVTSAHTGAALLRLDQEHLAVHEVWRREGARTRDPNTLHSLISTPYIAGDHIYGVHQRGELVCLELMTGRRIWEDESVMPTGQWHSMHIIGQGDRVWIFNQLGELVIGRLSPDGFEQISRAKLIEPTTAQLPRRDGVTWSHPAFANRHVFARNDRRLVAADLSADQ